VPQERYIGGLSPVGLPYLSPLTLSLVRPITYFNEISRDMLHGQRATTKLVPRQRRFIYRVSALAFWTTYLILSIARRALRALSHRKFTLHFLTKISTRQALCASPFRGCRQAAALIFYFPTLTSLYTFGRAPNDVVVPTVIQHPNMDVTSHPSVRDTFGG